MDEKTLEMAEALTTALVDNGIERIRAQVKRRDPNFDGSCEECGDSIPEARLDTGAVTCIECQELLEQQRAHYRK